MQGAGGVGGLLAINNLSNGVHFAAFDGNGNVAGLVKATDGSTSANYEYGPFGELLHANGAMAKVNPLRFSTKYQDDETDLFYYGYRYLNTSTGRWISRDPTDERGGNNLYLFVRNNPVALVDFNGLRPISFAFDAFINNRLGSWLWEPFNHVDQFETDERGFGGFDPVLGNARLFSYGTIESTLIGSAANGGASGTSDTGTSHRRHNMNWNPLGTRDWYYEEKRASVQNPDPVIQDYPFACKTTITFCPSAGYPFTPSALTPNIDYSVTFTFFVVGPTSVKVSVSGSRNKFPDYEAYVDGSLVYTYPSSSSGPGVVNLNTRTDIPPNTGATVTADVPPNCCRRYFPLFPPIRP